MTNPIRVRSGTRSALIGVLVAMCIIATVAVTTVVVQIGNSDASSPPPLPPTAQPAPMPESEQPTVTETVTVDPAPAGPSAPTVVTTTEIVTPAPPPPVTTTEIVTPPPPPPPVDPTIEPPVSNSDTEIRDTTATAFSAINGYWSDLFSGWVGNSGEPIRWDQPGRYRGDGFYDSTVGDFPMCLGEIDVEDANNAFYCPHKDASSGNPFVAWDMNLFQYMKSHYGDGPIYNTVAHEIGHAAQGRFKRDGEYGAVPPSGDTVRNELQADCLGAAALVQAVRDGYITVSSSELTEISMSTRELNEDGGDHGTDAQRIAAFNLGYGGNIESCLYNQGVSPAPGVI